MRTCLLLATLLQAATCFAVDINTATVADLDGIKGIGPALSRRILAERDRGPFQDWAALATRVKGLRGGKAAALSAEGLTVNGIAFQAAPAPRDEGKPHRTGTKGKNEAGTQ